jgi:hypothetical protein
VSPGSSRKLVTVTMLIATLTLGCTLLPGQAPPATQDAAQKPAVSPSPSPSPAAQATPTTAPPRPVVGGGAAQPRANATFQAPGGNAIVVVPTPNFSTNATSVPAALAPAVSLSTPQVSNIPQVTGTLSRIPTAITAGGGGGGGAGGGGAGGGGGASGGGSGGSGAGAAAGAAAAGGSGGGGSGSGGGGGGGGAGGIQTIPVVITSTPLVRIVQQPQPAIVFPGGGGGGGGSSSGGSSGGGR